MLYLVSSILDPFLHYTTTSNLVTQLYTQSSWRRNWTDEFQVEVEEMVEVEKGANLNTCFNMKPMEGVELHKVKDCMTYFGIKHDSFSYRLQFTVCSSLVRFKE